MITLKAACKIAKETLEEWAGDYLIIYPTCSDMGDSWAFSMYPRNEQDRIWYIGCDVIQINKETGALELVYVGLPGQKLFDEWYYSPEIDISQYLKELDNV